MGWRIPEEEIERVKGQTDLVALVRSRGIELKRHGSKDWVGRCPFHPDKNTPNFIVSPDKGLFHCMVCGKAGNPIQFVQFHDGVSFRHAYEVLAHGQAAAFTTSHQGPLKQGTVPRLPCPVDVEADDATLMAQVAAYYHQRLKETPAARAYLASRDLDSDELTGELREAILEHKIEQVLLAYDADQAGDRAAERDVDRFRASGIEVLRVRFPHGMDANDYARKVTPANKSLGLLLNSAAWLSGKKAGPSPTAASPRNAETRGSSISKGVNTA